MITLSKVLKDFIRWQPQLRTLENQGFCLFYRFLQVTKVKYLQGVTGDSEERNLKLRFYVHFKMVDLKPKWKGSRESLYILDFNLI